MRQNLPKRDQKDENKPKSLNQGSNTRHQLSRAYQGRHSGLQRAAVCCSMAAKHMPKQVENIRKTYQNEQQ